jgi:formate hydrogenlyase transcriptional activator
VLIVDGDFYEPYSLYITGLESLPKERFGDLLSRFSGVPSDRIPDRIPMADSVMEYLRSTGQPYVCPDLTRQQRFAEEPRLLTYKFRAYILCPLIVHDHMIGAIRFVFEHPRDFAEEEVLLFSEIAQFVAIAVANARAYQEIDALRQKLQQENLVLRENIAETTGFEELVGASASLRHVLAAIDKVAATDSTVLILGETGTGKELIAKAIHNKSKRSSQPMVKVNCAAIPESLIASELFGHERGAFTGAAQRRIGRFEMAHQSSLFLDEVGELPMEMQATLLRVLQEQEFERVGGSQTVRVDTRVIAATNRNLQQAVSEGRFRTDLYYRLNVFPIEVPPLRERRQDIPILVEYFISRCSERIGKKIVHMERDAMDLLVGYHWPGNIRELQNVIERAVILAEEGILRIEPRVLGVTTVVTDASAPSAADVLHEHERGVIESALAETRGKVAGREGAAARLRVPPSTLESKIRALRINKHKFRSASF